MLRVFRSWLLGLTLALGVVSTLSAEPPRKAASALGQDGPQVLWKGDEATVYRLEGGKVKAEKHHGTFDLPLPGLAARSLRLDPRGSDVPQARFPLPVRILAVSDIHGRLDTLMHLLKAQKVVDGDLHWRFGKGHLVVVGDVMDRGPQVTEAFWFLRGLAAAAARAGGRVHLLLGNHEVMVMTGDLRYVNPKYLRAPEGWPILADQYGRDSELGRWLRTRPAMVAVGPFLFVHGGLSPEFQARHPSLEAVNAELRATLAKGVGSKQDTGPLGSQGPVWYRGLLPEGGPPQATDGEIQGMLEAFGAQAFVVGHTTLEHLGVFHGGRVFGIDAGIKDGQSGEAWLWEKGRTWRAKADGTREPLAP